MSFQFVITTGAGTAIYRQLVDQVKGGIASEALREGDQLPSVRALAELLVVNPNTIAKAYGDMVREGLVETAPGKGYFIAHRLQILTREEQERRLSAAADSFVNEVVLLDFTRAELIDAVEQRLLALEPAKRTLETS